jgi:YD repeat-containing protein
MNFKKSLNAIALLTAIFLTTSAGFAMEHHVDMPLPEARGNVVDPYKKQNNNFVPIALQYQRNSPIEVAQAERVNHDVPVYDQQVQLIKPIAIRQPGSIAIRNETGPQRLSKIESASAVDITLRDDIAEPRITENAVELIPSPTVNQLTIAQKDVVTDIESTLRRQSVSQAKSVADIAQIEQDVTINYLRSQDPAILTELLFNAPAESTVTTPINRASVWSAITTNMADGLGINAAGRVIKAQVKNIRDKTSKTLDRILGDRGTTDGVKQTRINQLLANIYKAFQDLAATLQALPTQASDLLSGSETSITRDAQGNIIRKSVEKPDDSTIHYTYKDGKTTSKTIIHYIEDPQNPELLQPQSTDLYQYDTNGKINSLTTTQQPQQVTVQRNEMKNGKKIKSKTITASTNSQYQYDAQGKLTAIKTMHNTTLQYTPTRGTIFSSIETFKTETTYFENNKQVANIIIMPNNKGSIDIIYDCESLTQPTASGNYSVQIPEGLKNVEPVINLQTGKLIGWKNSKNPTTV